MLSALGVKVTLGDAMDNRHVMRTFFKKIPNNWPILVNGPNKLWGNNTLFFYQIEP